MTTQQGELLIRQKNAQTQRPEWARAYVVLAVDERQLFCFTDDKLDAPRFVLQLRGATVGRVDGAWAGRSVVPSFQPFFPGCWNAAQEPERRGGIAAVVEDCNGVAASAQHARVPRRPARVAFVHEFERPAFGRKVRAVHARFVEVRDQVPVHEQ